MTALKMIQDKALLYYLWKSQSDWYSTTMTVGHQTKYKRKKNCANSKSSFVVNIHGSSREEVGGSASGSGMVQNTVDPTCVVWVRYVNRIKVQFYTRHLSGGAAHAGGPRDHDHER